MSRALNKNEKNAERVWHRITGAHFNLFNSHDILSTTPMSWLGLEMPACVRAYACEWLCVQLYTSVRERGREKRWMDLKFSHIYSCRAGEPCSAHHRPRPPPAQRRRRRLGTGQHREPNIKRKKNLVMIEFFLSFKDVSKEIRSRGDEKNFLRRIFWTNWDLSRSKGLDKKANLWQKCDWNESGLDVSLLLPYREEIRYHWAKLSLNILKKKFRI